MNFYKSEKGVTMILLVITVIVLSTIMGIMVTRGSKEKRQSVDEAKILRDSARAYKINEILNDEILIRNQATYSGEEKKHVNSIIDNLYDNKLITSKEHTDIKYNINKKIYTYNIGDVTIDFRMFIE